MDSGNAKTDLANGRGAAATPSFLVLMICEKASKRVALFSLGDTVESSLVPRSIISASDSRLPQGHNLYIALPLHPLLHLLQAAC